MIADLLKMFGLVGISESKYEQYLGQLEEYMSSKNLPDELRIRLLKYYEYKLQKHYFNENQILATLSEHLRIEMFLFGARKLIEKAQLLKTLPRTTLASLFASMSTETFMPTDIITKAGQPVEDVYFISSGTVAVVNAANTEITHLEDGDEFGFLVTEDGKLIYTHIAVETSEIYYISKKLFLEFLGAHPEIFKYFENKVKKRIEKFDSIETTLLLGGNDILSSLRSGKLLERQAVRSVNFEFEN
nr:potassium/sodium hyperpolarization-activated cyclic nucleotide-gated channel 4-like [Leptinotarsa decemlineata]